MLLEWHMLRLSNFTEKGSDKLNVLYRQSIHLLTMAILYRGKHRVE